MNLRDNIIAAGVSGETSPALITAGEACLLGATGILIPLLLQHPQTLVGVAVNFALVYAALRASSVLASLPLILLPSLAALAGGYLFDRATGSGITALIPAIWAGNFVLVAAVRWSRISPLLALLGGAAAKAAVIGFGALLVQRSGWLPAGFVPTFVAVVFVTGLVGGLAALPVALARNRQVARHGL